MLTGGYSPEWEISLLTGQTVLQHLDNQEFEAYELRILPISWNVHVQNDSYPVDRRDLSWRDAEGRMHHFDLAFNAIHGHPGENGVLQGYLETLGIPLAGSGLFASALTFNKAQTSTYAARWGARTAPSVLLRKGDQWKEEDLLAKLQLPLFVKPNRSGSSFGISKVRTSADLKGAIAEAFQHDDLIVVEQGISGTELACGISDHNGEAEVLGITEIVPKNDWFDYESKYSGASEEITPARISKRAEDEVRAMSLLLYRQFELRGIARIDYILDSDDQAWLIEINSVPGMSAESIVPKQLRWKGLELSDIFGQIARSCLQKE